MRSHISPAIIMRVTEFAETDLLVGFFTMDKGRLKGIAKGARKSRQRFANCLDLFCLTSLEYDPVRRGDFHLLQSGKLINGFSGLRSAYSALSLASYMVELTEILFPPGVEDRRMFSLLEAVFHALDQGLGPDILRIPFEVKAMTLGGYAIDFDKCCNCGRPYAGEGEGVFIQERGGISCLKCQQPSKLRPGLSPETVGHLRAMQQAPINRITEFLLSAPAREEIRPVLDLHMAYRIGRRLKTAKYLE